MLQFPLVKKNLFLLYNLVFALSKQFMNLNFVANSYGYSGWKFFKNFHNIIKVLPFRKLYISRVKPYSFSVQLTLETIVGSLQAANFPPTICTPKLAKMNMTTIIKMVTSTISLNPRKNSRTTRRMCGTKV